MPEHPVRSEIRQAMRVLIAFDKFKYALTARQACEAAAQGLRAAHSDWQLDLCPLTDGGEGFCETLTQAGCGQFETLTYSGPRGQPINAPMGYVIGGNLSAPVQRRLGLDANSTLAVVEMAAASGLALLPPAQRDPWQTSSVGTGEQLRAAAKAGANVILLGVGGSATNDLGLGALAALGFKFLDVNGAAIALPKPNTWERIVRIDPNAAIALPPIFIACDVTNPLLGPLGATTVFGPQKGLRAPDLVRFEHQAERLAALLCDACAQPHTLTTMPGAGAAGGIAFGLMVACGAKLVSGFDLVAEWLELSARVAAADLVLTGEGRFDVTSLGGKGPGSLVAAAQRLGKPVHIFAGSVKLPEDLPALTGVAAHAITPDSMPVHDALPQTAELLIASVTREM